MTLVEKIGNIIKRIKFLFKAIPLIWNNERWDFVYLLTWIKFKIDDDMILYKNSKFEADYKTYSELKVVSRLIDLIQNEYYRDEYHEYYNDNFREWLYSNEPKYSEEVKDNLHIYLKKYPNDYRRAGCKVEYSNQKNAILIGVYRHNKAKRILFNLFETKLETWWN